MAHQKKQDILLDTNHKQFQTEYRNNSFSQFQVPHSKNLTEPENIDQDIFSQIPTKKRKINPISDTHSNTNPKNNDSQATSLTNVKCYRHASNKFLSEYSKTNQKLANELNELPLEESKPISKIWETFSSSSAENKMIILEGIVNMCCVRQLSYLNQTVPNHLKIDFVSSSPPEIALKIFSYLDAKSLCQASRVSKTWAQLANDDVLWHRMCVQHIDKVCHKCGWGLPLLKSKNRKIRTVSEAVTQAKDCDVPPPNATNPTPKSINIDSNNQTPFPPKENNMKLISNSKPQNANNSPKKSEKDETKNTNTLAKFLQRDSDLDYNKSFRKPWKQVFAERQAIAKNWKLLRYKKTEIPGKGSEITCMHLSDDYIVSGYSNGLVKINSALDGELINSFEAHTQAVTSLNFDECKLITGSLDGSIKMWCYRNGVCINTIQCFRNSGVTSVTIKDKLVATGSSSGLVSIFDFNLGKSYSLPGHDDRVNGLLFYGENYLFSCSDDLTIRRYDLSTRLCTHIYNGHSFSISSISFNITASLNKKSNGSDFTPKLFSSSLDGTIRVWDIDSGKCLHILCCQSVQVWSIASDAFRMVSAHNDGKVCVWDSETHRLLHTIDVSDTEIETVSLSDTCIVTGDKNGNISVFDFKNLH
ncbi:hypothetical protein BB558_001252 [Smittium angustum]|uniref:F-box domain-containing protein n=1 Tax=Smittium angustum TaxID=133377 RepID=A0A2U1JC70_SMIAN|nr:hypothetical protein BB558_001252 [Smittium angustum]